MKQKRGCLKIPSMPHGQGSRVVGLCQLPPLPPVLHAWEYGCVGLTLVDQYLSKASVSSQHAGFGIHVLSSSPVDQCQVAPCQEAALGQLLGLRVLGGASVAAAAPSPSACLADWGQLSRGLCSPLWLSGPRCRNFSGFFASSLCSALCWEQILSGFIQQWD